MIKGIERAVQERLELMRYGRWNTRPVHAWPLAFQRAVEKFLEAHKDEIIAAIAERK